MPNPTTTHADEQNIKSFKIGGFRFHKLPIGDHPKPHTPRLEIISNYADEYIDEPDATKLVAMILQVFPNIREQIKESKP